MTHTVHPYAHRLGIIRDWRSRWFTTDRKQYRENIRQDALIRSFLEKRFRGMYVSDIEIERDAKNLRITVRTSRPGLVIGRNGEGATKIRKELTDLVRGMQRTQMPEIKLDVEEIRSPESSASIVGQMIAEGLEKRLPYRRVMKQTADKVIANRDVVGVRIRAAGRLGGGDMKRAEEMKRGRIPLQTFRADVDFARVEAHMPYGLIGIKVWIYKGDIFQTKNAK